MSLLREAVSNYAAFGNLSTQSVSGASFGPVPRYASGETVTILDSDYIVLLTHSSAIDVELPLPEANAGRSLILRSVGGHAISSTIQNITPPNCLPGCTSSQITEAGDQAWAQLVSNGQYWLNIAGNNLYLD